MKNIFFLLLFLFVLQMYSQEKVITTQEEYNYLTRGYSQDVKENHVKAGYILEKFYHKNYQEFSFEYYYFNHIASGKTKAILVIAKKEKGDNDKVKYICFPFNNPDLLKQCSNDFSMGITMNDIFNSVNNGLLIKSLDLIKNNPSGKFE